MQMEQKYSYYIMSRVFKGSVRKMPKTFKKGILKQGSRQHITNKNIINLIEEEEKERKNALNMRVVDILKGKNNAFKKSFKSQYNKYYKNGNHNRHIRSTLRKLTGINTGKSVKFQTILGTKF